MPAETALVDQLGLSRPVIRELLSELEGDGLVSRRQGSPTRINTAALELEIRLDHHTEYAALLQKLGYQPTLELLAAEVQATPRQDDSQTSSLRLPPSKQVLHTRKRWRADQTVAMVAWDYIALPPSHNSIPADLHDPVFGLIEQLHNDSIEWTISRPRAEAVSAELSQLIELPAQSPVMVIRETGLTRSGLHLWSSIEWHHPDLIDYALVRVVI